MDEDNVLTSSMDNTLLEEYEEVLRLGKKLNLRYWDDPVLSEVCRPVAKGEFGNNLTEFGNLLLFTLKESGTGVGLAASQVGLRKRMFAMKFVDNDDLSPIVVCNPVLSEFEGRSLADEGCLSLPTIYDQVERAQFVRMEFQYLNGDERVLELEGMEARIAQHEVDHLDGIMFFQRMSKQMRKNVLRQWAKIQNKYD
jgi:peptide deformylase